MKIDVNFNSEQLNRIERNQHTLMATLDQIASDINDESTLIDGLGTLIQGLKDQVIAAKGDQAKIDAIFAKAEANKAKLADALKANTATDVSGGEPTGDTPPTSDSTTTNPPTA